MLGKSMDNSDDAFNGDTIQNAYDLRSTWALSEFDVPQNLVTNFDVPASDRSWSRNTAERMEKQGARWLAVERADLHARWNADHAHDEREHRERGSECAVP